MKKFIIFLCIVVSLHSNDEISISTPKIKITDNYFSIEDSDDKKDQTLFEKIENDVSYVAVKDQHNQNSISFRGMKSTATNIIEDLIPSYRTTGGNVDFYYDYNMYKLNSNMLLSPSSLGVSSMGSDIELFSKTPEQQYEGEVAFSFSQYDNQQKLYLGTGEKEYYVQLYINNYRQNNYKLPSDFNNTIEQPSKTRLNSDNHQNSFEIKSGYRINDKNSFSFKYKNTKSDYGLEPNIYDNSDGYKRMNQKDLQSIYGYYDYLDENLEMNFRLYYDDYQDIYDYYTDNTYSSLLFPSSLFDDSRIGLIAKAKFEKDLDELSFVLRGEKNEHIWKREGNIHIPEFQFQEFNGSVIGKKVFNNITIDSALTYKDFRPVNVTYDGDPSYTQNDQGSKNKALDYQIGLNYLINNGVWYLSHSKTTKIPSMAEMFAFFPWDKINTDLEAEKSNNIEIGYKHFLDTGLYSLSLFHYNIKDKIANDNGEFVNLNKAIHEGAEFRYESRYKNHNLKLSYSYLSAKDGDNKNLELIPRDKLVLEDKIDLDNVYSTNIQYIYIGKREDKTDSGIKELNAYSLVNLYLNANYSKNLNLTIGVNNLFDKYYESAYGYPNEARNIYGKLTWKF